MKTRQIKTDEIFLCRFAFLPEGTLGQLILPGGYECFVIERPWKNNQKFVSCIPNGEYPLAWNDVKGKHFAQPLLLNVPNRSSILIHPANYPSDLLGCLGPGREWAVKAQSPWVSDSRLAFDDLIKILGDPAPGQPMNKKLIIYSTTAEIET